MYEIAITFIIPAYNEEQSLPKVLGSIVTHTPKSLAYEIIVADNGSQDDTVRVAQSFSAHVFSDDTATVGGLRNSAAALAHGNVLVFIDADILLTTAWGKNIERVYQALITNPWQVTGSRCGVATRPSWIERYWFKPLLELKPRYINSGHLITTRKLFKELGGFDDQLESGEDYAFCMTASASKALIINNPALAVIHEGYPKTLLQFVRREIWHGKGDCESIQRIKSSNVALASLLFVGLNGFSILMLLSSESSIISTSGFLLAIVLCMTLALFKHGARSFKSIIIVSALYYFYLLSRFLSCMPLMNATTGQGRHRDGR